MLCDILPNSFAVALTTFGIVFLAELGDKTQLTAMALATKHPWGKTFVGIAGAFAVLNILAVLVGKALFALLPLFLIKGVAGGLFVLFGISSFRSSFSEAEEEEEEKKLGGHGPVLTAFVMILLAELGDKTQLVTMSLAAQYNKPVPVFVGSTIALWAVSLLGIFLGCQIMRFIPLPWIHRGAGCLFLLFGAIILFQAYAVC